MGLCEEWNGLEGVIMEIFGAMVRRGMEEECLVTLEQMGGEMERAVSD